MLLRMKFPIFLSVIEYLYRAFENHAHHRRQVYDQSVATLPATEPMGTSGPLFTGELTAISVFG